MECHFFKYSRKNRKGCLINTFTMWHSLIDTTVHLTLKSLLWKLTPHAQETRAFRRSLRWCEESASAIEWTSVHPTAYRRQGLSSFVHIKAKWDSILHLRKDYNQKDFRKKNSDKKQNKTSYCKYMYMQLTALTIHNDLGTFEPEFHNCLDMVPICRHKLHHALLDH